MANLTSQASKIIEFGDAALTDFPEMAERFGFFIAEDDDQEFLKDFVEVWKPRVTQGQAWLQKAFEQGDPNKQPIACAVWQPIGTSPLKDVVARFFGDKFKDTDWGKLPSLRPTTGFD